MPVQSESAGETVPETPTIVRHPRLGSGTQSRSRSLVDPWESLDGPHRGSFSMEVAARGKKGSLYEHSPSRRSFDVRPPSSVDAEVVIPVAYHYVATTESVYSSSKGSSIHDSATETTPADHGVGHASPTELQGTAEVFRERT